MLGGRPAVFVKTMVCWRCSFLQALKNWFCPLSCKDFLGRTSTFLVQFSAVPTHNLRERKTWRRAQNGGRWWLIVRVLALRLEEMTRRWQFLSGMIVLFAVNLRQLSIFVEHLKKMQCRVFNYFSLYRPNRLTQLKPSRHKTLCFRNFHII